MQKKILNILIFLFLILILPNFAYAAPVPVLNFSDIDSGPKTGNTDPAANGGGAIVTIWGNYLGSTQGSSKVYVGGVEATAIYYWKNADGTLPGGPADLYTYHKMQEIAFAIPPGAPDGSTTIEVIVGGNSPAILPFTVRNGNIYFIKSTGDDTTGNGSWSNPWQTLQDVFNGGNGKLTAGDIVYSAGVDSTAGLSVGFGGPIKGTQLNPVSLTSYPNTTTKISGHAAGNNKGNVITNWWATDAARSSEYINLSKLSITAAGATIADDSSNGIKTFKGNRIIGVEITGPTVYGGYGGAITGGGGDCSTAGCGENGAGGKYYGIYIHDYGWQSTTAGIGNYGWVYHPDSISWTSPGDCASHAYYARPSCSEEVGGCTYDNLNCRFSMDRFQHLYYISNRSKDGIDGYEIAWNNLVNNHILAGIHIYDQGTVGGWNTAINIHNNVVKNQGGSSIDSNYPNAGVGLNIGKAAPINIYNNIIINDTDNITNGRGIDIQGSGAGKIYNNTIYGYRYVNVVRPATSDFRNNIVIENIQPQPSEWKFFIYDTPTNKSNNLIYGLFLSPLPTWFSSSAGDLNVNPGFTDPNLNDFSLQSTSPAIAAGSDATLSIAPTDFYGQPRPAGSVSIGALQYVSNDSDTISPNSPSGLIVQ